MSIRDQGRVALAMMAGATLCLLAAPIYPLAGPITYVVLWFTFPRGARSH